MGGLPAFCPPAGFGQHRPPSVYRMDPFQLLEVLNGSLEIFNPDCHFSLVFNRC